MEQSVSAKISSLIGFAKSFHLYSRYQLAKTLHAPLAYGEGFGDAEVLRQAKEDFLKHEQAYKTDSDAKDTETSYGNTFVFEETEPTPDGSVALTLEVRASHKKLADFLGKDFLLDISPESVHIIFPDLTFFVPVKEIAATPWEILRTELQESELLEKDMAHILGDAISLDLFRKKLKNITSTDGELIELRKKMYALAYTINDSFETDISRYEK